MTFKVKRKRTNDSQNVNINSRKEVSGGGRRAWGGGRSCHISY